MTDYAPTMDAIFRDHTATLATIARLDSYRDALRALVVTLTTAAVGVGVANSSKVPVSVAIPLVIVLFWGDARAGFDYQAAQQRSRVLEDLIQAYVTYGSEVGGSVAEEAEQQLQDQIDSYEFGSAYLVRDRGFRTTLSGSLDYSAWFAACYLVTVLALGVCVYTIN